MLKRRLTRRCRRRVPVGRSGWLDGQEGVSRSLRRLEAEGTNAGGARICQSGEMRGWWLDEVASAGQEHLDEAYVAGYERKSSRGISGSPPLLSAYLGRSM